MIYWTLYLNAANGKLVHQTEIAPFEEPPEVILYGEAVYKIKGMDKSEGSLFYVETTFMEIH